MASHKAINRKPKAIGIHTPGGQILIITDGVGHHQIEGNSIEVMRKGDVVKCPLN